MQIEISQSRQFKYSIVYVVKIAISYNCFPTIMQHFVFKKCFHFKTPDGAASISSPSYYLNLSSARIPNWHKSSDPLAFKVKALARLCREAVWGRHLAPNHCRAPSVCGIGLQAAPVASHGSLPMMQMPSVLHSTSSPIAVCFPCTHTAWLTLCNAPRNPPSQSVYLLLRQVQHPDCINSGRQRLQQQAYQASHSKAVVTPVVLLHPRPADSGTVMLCFHWLPPVQHCSLSCNPPPPQVAEELAFSLVLQTTAPPPLSGFCTREHCLPIGVCVAQIWLFPGC